RRHETPPPSPTPHGSSKPSASPTAQSAPPARSPAASQGSGLDLSEPFTSSQFRYSIVLPARYTILTGDPPWPLAIAQGAPSNLVADYLKDGSTTSNQLYAASWPVAKNVKPEAWLAAYEAAGVQTGVTPACRATVVTMERTTIDGHPAWVHAG